MTKLQLESRLSKLSALVDELMQKNKELESKNECHCEEDVANVQFEFDSFKENLGNMIFREASYEELVEAITGIVPLGNAPVLF